MQEKSVACAEMTAYIVPAWSDQAGQCRIVLADGRHMDPARSYKANPGLWKEVGLMNSQGRLVCCENIGNLREELKDCEPLMAGLSLRVQAPPAELAL